MGGLSRFNQSPRVVRSPNITNSVSTPEEFLRDSGYGPHWPQVRESLLSAPQPSNPNFKVEYTGKAMEENLSRPVTTNTIHSRADDRLAGRNEALPEDRVINLSHGEAEELGLHPSYSRHHENTHILQRSKAGLGAGLYPHLKPVEDMAARRMLDQGVHPVLIPRAAMQAGYASTLDELGAFFGHAKRLDYGMTGRPIITPQQHYDALNRWRTQGIRVNDDPAGQLDIYGPDQTMQYGPNAGQPAHGFEYIKGQLQHVLPDDTSEKRIRQLIEFMRTFADNEQPGEAVHG